MSLAGFMFVAVGTTAWVAGLASLVLIGLVRDGGTALRALQITLMVGSLIAWAGTLWLFAAQDEYLPVLVWASVNFAAIVPIGAPIFFLFTIPSRRRQGWLPPQGEA
ncbi:MAG: hypothetical protein Q7V14_05610 [Coriobacteriia bacterium]|nr:hypothetical protein [Coriobacteriia bacterium]